MPSLCRTKHPNSSLHAAAGESCLFTQVQQLRDDSASDEQVVLAMAEVLGHWPMTDSYVDQVRTYLQPFSLTHAALHGDTYTHACEAGLCCLFLVQALLMLGCFLVHQRHAS